MNENKIGYESYYVEMKAMQLQVLENIEMYADGIYEMANYTTNRSGLPYPIWFDDLGQNRKNTHNIPRLKIHMPSGNLIPIAISNKPYILLKGTQLRKAEKELTDNPKKEMFDFISKNHKLILQHWNGDIDSITLFEKLKL